MAAWDLSDMAQDMSRLKATATFVAAQNDKTIPPGVAQKAAALCPHGHVLPVAHFGHLMHEEDPKQAADIIRNTSL
jgi:magnesium chelatase accessory protein